MKTKRVWTVGDFARHKGISHRRAMRQLRTLDARSGGKLLFHLGGKKGARRYLFVRATLMKLDPDFAASSEGSADRVEEIRELLAELRSNELRLARATAAQTRKIAKLSPRGPNEAKQSRRSA